MGELVKFMSAEDMSGIVEEDFEKYDSIVVRGLPDCEKVVATIGNGFLGVDSTVPKTGEGYVVLRPDNTGGSS
ncbi:hypothetical protein K8R30_03870 [archaeon]|nr:hypothetical protein [archaeon]